MPEKIIIRLNDPASIAEAIEKVKKFRDKIDTGSKELVRKMADQSVQSAAQSYATAEYAGNNDVHVETYPDGDLRCRVSAEGEAALFIEFGTGIMKSDSPEARADLKSGNVLSHGQYGYHLGKMKNGWRYEGSAGQNPPADTETIKEGPYAGWVKTKGNDATPALYQAKKEVQRNLPDLVKEVFDDR